MWCRQNNDVESSCCKRQRPSDVKRNCDGKKKNVVFNGRRNNAVSKHNVWKWKL